MEILIVVGKILLVVLGVSFVIFWHELGHFLVAKWNGVYVKTFSIGFPPTMIRLFKYRETDYVLSWIPLGGYVRMLGEEESEDPEQVNNPAAYHNKSVGQRMAIISAGVIMNVILGLICFVAVYMMGGLPETPAIIGSVSPGGPAYEAGMRPGDVIEEIDEHTEVTFNTLLQVVAHSGADQVVRFAVKRPGVEEQLEFRIEPLFDPIRKIPTIRISSAPGLKLAKTLAFVPPAGMEGEPTGPDGGFKPGDRIVAVGPVGGDLEDVKDAFALDRLLDRYRSEPLEFLIERSEPLSLGKTPEDQQSSGQRLTITVPPNPFVDLGMRMTTGPITSIRPGSPAETAELRKGDRIVAVDGDEDFDPLRLPELAFERVGEPIELTIRRPAVDGQPVSERVVEITPEPGSNWTATRWDDEPLNVDSLGLALAIEPKVAGVRTGSPADRAGIKAGALVQSIRVTSPSLQDDSAKPQTRVLELGPTLTWTPVFDLLQQTPVSKLLLTLADSDQPIPIELEPVPDWFDPRRGLLLDSPSTPLPPLPLSDALRRGSAETLETVTSIYRIIRSLFQQRVGRENISGPIRIAQVAYAIVGDSIPSFIKFIGFLSINLAVINFLPIPPLDGGQMVFLVGEKVRGRPLPKSCLDALLNLGILFILGLMVFVIFQDVFLTFFSR